ncbi:hypothetical protein FLP41_16535 [Paracoccus marcusii]|nr:hypothetical protein FLP41_16535 [Paracoccus marcusii]
MRQAAGAGVGAVGQTHAGQRVPRLRVQACVARDRGEEAEAAARMGLHGGGHVLQHGEARQDRGDLEAARHARPDPRGHGTTHHLGPAKRTEPASDPACPESCAINVDFPRRSGR